MFYHIISSKMYVLSEQFNAALMGFIYLNKFTYQNDYFCDLAVIWVFG